MSIGNVMRTGVSGMLAQANKLSTVATNIANSDTTGYKRAETEFSSRNPQSTSGNYVSGGVTTKIRYRISEQGSLLSTTSITDLAIDGEGFFLVEDSTGEKFLTRAGSFVPDGSGYLVNSAGFFLLGYVVGDDQDPAPTANGYAGLERVKYSDINLEATPSTLGELNFNLPASASVVSAASLPSTNAATAEYTSKTSIVTFGNLGEEELIDIYFTKTADNTWEVAVFSRSDAAAGGSFPYSGGPLVTTTLQFDPSNGKLATGSANSVTFTVPNGAALTLDLSKASQLAADFNILKADVNGNAASGYELFEIDESGTMYGSYANGEREAIYKIPLANVRSPDNLRLLQGDIFTPTVASGDLLIGFAYTDGFGYIISGAKEQSTVDLATELTAMIEAQRGYSANSKVFQAGSELMDVVVNLKR